jgi:putative flavoprotein involved in K+ transport
VILIVGAGVSGLAAAKCLSDLNVAAALVDRRDEVGGAYARMHSGIQLTSPARYLSLPGAPMPGSTKYLSAGQYSSYIREYAERNRLCPRRRDVRSVRRNGSSFSVRFDDADTLEDYEAVVVCSGMFDYPSTPSLASPPFDRGGRRHTIRLMHASDWRGPLSHSGQRLVIVGSGVSAVEIAEECVRAGLHPIVSTKASVVELVPQHVLGFDPRSVVYPLMRRAPLWGFRRQCSNGWQHRGVDRGFSEYRQQRLLDTRPMIRDIEKRRVTFEDGSSADADVIVFATGYRFDMPFLPSELPRRYQGIPHLRRGESVAWPGLFFLGVPCASSAGSHFVHGIAADAPVVAKRIASGRRCF